MTQLTPPLSVDAMRLSINIIEGATVDRTSLGVRLHNVRNETTMLFSNNRLWDDA